MQVNNEEKLKDSLPESEKNESFEHIDNLYNERGSLILFLVLQVVVSTGNYSGLYLFAAFN